MRLPGVGSKAGGIPEVIDGAAILFDPHSPHSTEELSDAILKVTCEPEVRRDLADRGASRGREVHLGTYRRGHSRSSRELA